MSGHHKLEGDVAKKAINMLSHISAVLDKFKVKYNLEGGTLLGIIREDRLLPWDDDLDITITSSELPSALNALNTLDKKYRIRYRFHFTNHKAITKGKLRLIRITDRKLFFFKGKVRMDIFIKYKDAEHYYWTVGSPTDFVIKKIPTSFYENLFSYKWKEVSYLIPHNYDDYLSLRYGNWKEAVKVWDCKSDDKAKVNIDMV